MTAKRNFKRRVRERQARTGERYTVSRRKILAERAGASPEEAVSKAIPEEEASKAIPEEVASKAAPEEAVWKATPKEVASKAASTEAASGAALPKAASGTAPLEAALMTALVQATSGAPPLGAASLATASGTVPVVELLDVSEEAARLGFRCRIAMFPALAERAQPAGVLTALCDALVGTTGDPSTALLGSVALHGHRPPQPKPALLDWEVLQRFFRRARAGVGGTIEDGSMLVFYVAGRDGIVPVLCTLSYREPSLLLSVISDAEWEAWDHLAAPRVPAVRVAREQRSVLFLIHDGQRYPVTTDELVIGSHPETSGLAIGDKAISPRHAAVIRRSGHHYLKGLESTDGIVYKGMRIDNKRIDEGDVFHIGEHELRFTYRADG